MSQDVEPVVTVVSAGPVGLSDAAKLDTLFTDCSIGPTFTYWHACIIVLLVALLFAFGCIWRWYGNRTRRDIRERCRIWLFATASVVLFNSAASLVLGHIVTLECLGGGGEAASGMRMLATSQTLDFFCIDFAVFSVIFLLALILGLYETTTASPAVKNEDGLDNRKPGSAP